MVFKVHFPAEFSSNPNQLRTPGLEFAVLLLNYYNCIFGIITTALNHQQFQLQPEGLDINLVH